MATDTEGGMITCWCKNCGTQFKDVANRRGRAKQFCRDRCRKHYWDKTNVWKYQDTCPSCGGLKHKVAKTCRRCAKPNNPTGINGR